MDKFVIRKSGQINIHEDMTTSQVPSTSNTEENSRKRKKSEFIGRRYDENYLKFGFCAFNMGEHNNLVQPQCVVCGELLANESLKPSKLKRHLDTKHPNLKEKPIEYFESLKPNFHKNQKIIKKYSSVSQSALKASFLVSYRIAKCLKPYTVGEELILPAAIEMCTEMINEKVANQLKNIPLSDTTVARRISLISNDLKLQLLSRLTGKFSLQLDESTDIANEAILLTYVRYFYNNKIHEDILFSSKLETSTTGKNIFDTFVNFFTNNNVDLKNCISITTDGAAAMTGKHVGLIKLVKDIVPSLKWTHCIIHREALASKKMPKTLTDVLAQIVKIVNYIKSNALNSRLFKTLCLEMGSFHESLLLHTEVRWLSRGKCLQRVYELRHEIILFLNSKSSIYKDLFEDSKWIITLAYLADIFNLLNELNLSMQGNFFNIFDHTKKIESFKKKLRIIKARVSSGNIDNFTNVSEFLEEDSSIKFEDISELVNEHLTNLEQLFNQYFPEDIRVNYEWIEQPFAVDIMTVNMSTDIENQLIELSCDNKLKQMFCETSLEIFWAHLCTGNYAELATKAISILLIFPSTYLCEKAFSTMANLKTSKRNRLETEDDLRIALSQIEPRWNLLCENTQGQSSH